ncbi:MAG: class II aldolase/adducin family protein [Chloroflexota bacterium]
MIKQEQRMRREIVRIGRLMYDKGFISANEGNISARLAAGRLLITPTGLHKAFLQPEQLLLVDENGDMLAQQTPESEGLKPTSELPMHLEVYQRRPDVGAVVHAHPPITITLSIAGIPFDDRLLPEMIVLLGRVPVTEYATPASEENARAIRGLIKDHDALVLKRHGSLTVGADPMEAFMRLETVEQSARVAFMLAQLGVENPLPDHQLQKLLEMRSEMGLPAVAV